MGYRIELGEIETAILSMEEIDNACCLYDEEHKRIVSVFQSKQGIDGLAIRKRLMINSAKIYDTVRIFCS